MRRRFRRERKPAIPFEFKEVEVFPLRIRAACLTYADSFRATAACEFVKVKAALGYTDLEARHELAMWLGHNPHRTEVTYAYVPRNVLKRRIILDADVHFEGTDSTSYP